MFKAGPEIAALRPVHLDSPSSVVGRSLLQGMEPPGPGYSLELVLTAILEHWAAERLTAAPSCWWCRSCPLSGTAMVGHGGRGGLNRP
jgi:hypothetical protein